MQPQTDHGINEDQVVAPAHVQISREVISADEQVGQGAVKPKLTQLRHRACSIERGNHLGHILATTVLMHMCQWLLDWTHQKDHCW